jgi:cobalamin biosynthetic protein CobC
MASAPFAPFPTMHGGRLADARAAFPQAPTPWLDLSTGISPWAWTGQRANRADLQRLPDPVDVRGLEAAAAAAFGVDPRRVIATGGAEAGIALLAATLPLNDIDIVSPAYGGHAQAWTAAGAHVGAVTAADAASRSAAGLVIVNPNNPDGRVWPRAGLIGLAQRRSSRGAWTIVDEAFVEILPALSVAEADIDHLIVLRSFGKFYGLAGARLGFVIATQALAERLRPRLGDWPVCADAIALGRGAYADPGWADRQRERLQRAAVRLSELLMKTGFEVVGATDLFVLTACGDAPRRFERLCERGILTRPFDSDPTWLRFGLPGPRDWRRLETALRESALC